MNEESWKNGLKFLEQNGLNIFKSFPVKLLPNEFLLFFRQHEIPYEEYESIFLIAQGGGKLWECLPRPIKMGATDHPIDEFSLKAFHRFNEITLQDDFHYLLYPHQDLSFPLQKLSRHMGLSSASPIGIDINQDFGLWFAFRLLFLTKKKIDDELVSLHPSPCLKCEQKLCLLPHPFWEKRLACPYKKEHQYSNEQQIYHNDRLK